VTVAADAAVSEAFRDEWGRVVATLIRVFGDWDLAEECAQDAFEQALRSWTRDGVPGRPGAWLTTVARNRALDRVRRRAVEASKLERIATEATGAEGGQEDDMADGAIPDDRLRLIYTCCHPALPFEARIALTLRTLAGLSTAEIARAFLVPEQTMAKRLVRAKQKIRDARIPYRVPPAELLPSRTAGVLGVLYLLFNEGYAASAGDALVRRGLCAEAVRLTRVLVAMLPGEPEAAGLLSLMLFQSSRLGARVDGDGVLVTLDAQDRTLWDREAIAEAGTVLDAALAGGPVGPYTLQAAIAREHAVAADAAATDWATIAMLYGRLLEVSPSPVVELNRAIAVAMADGPAVGLELVDALEGAGRLRGYHLLHATRGELCRRLGRRAEAAAGYRRALEGARSEPERRHLERRLAEVDGEPPG
jgi:RNA polymerase sigma-70 factor (ECF subfamily)